MVGDNYANDVRGARAAGLRTVWFDPHARPHPATPPVHDAGVQRLTHSAGGHRRTGAVVAPGLADDIGYRLHSAALAKISKVHGLS